jgi:hypothetical protein
VKDGKNRNHYALDLVGVLIDPSSIAWPQKRILHGPCSSRYERRLHEQRAWQLLWHSTNTFPTLFGAYWIAGLRRCLISSPRCCDRHMYRVCMLYHGYSHSDLNNDLLIGGKRVVFRVVWTQDGRRELGKVPVPRLCFLRAYPRVRALIVH